MALRFVAGWAGLNDRLGMEWGRAKAVGVALLEKPRKMAMRFTDYDIGCSLKVVSSRSIIR
ncbi:hypothetical protein BJF91_08155 [Allorhizobium taibaishanense]|uniref:Uncharacterized protein n=1 Tax=Allorhizobium taibaishanense TaxID=887144 RepID=A0A1Q9A0U4_9HYPH|nr:hypothetical protein BJF91_08155 [Allorhizobium taibaishanense]